MLVSIQLDLERALWLLKEMKKTAVAEHAAEDAHHTALEQQQGADDDKPQRPV